ncbi:MAG: 4-hydroxy-tetrahydrodipicolinate reductase [Bacteroidetes bacterium]|nr:MAG: 4-hydroxy-tetrahydrodipicolinate reductase [Bacteroidota bacterium]
MKIVISGYGKMGKEVEAIAQKRGHQVIAKIDRSNEWDKFDAIQSQADVVIDFSQPEVVVDNLKRCFQAGVPIVTGTTGWYGQMEEVVHNCKAQKATLFYAPNFSIGVNIFFRANRQLAKLMAGTEGYSVQIDETHHIHKLDAPSGTAIQIAEGIISQNPNINKWVNKVSGLPSALSILSKREGEVTGNHEVTYDSEVDVITLKHEAKNRSGFALGAVLAAEFVQGKQGVFTMDDLLK